MKIVISDIPGYFPVGYPEQLYLDARPVSSVKDFSFVETSEAIQITNDESYRKRKIQTVFYDKYTIELIATETIDMGLVALAETVSVIQDSGEIHLAEMIDFQEPTKMQESEFLLYNITYRDLNSKVTVNHLTYDSEDNPSFSTELYMRKVYGGATSSLKSKILPIFSVSEYVRTTDDSNYIEMVSSESAFNTITFHSYMNEDDKNTVLENVNGLTGSVYPSGVYPFVYIKYDGDIYYPKNTPIVTVDGGELEGLFYVTITINYDQILNYPYE